MRREKNQGMILVEIQKVNTHASPLLQQQGRSKPLFDPIERSIGAFSLREDEDGPDL